ncbi:hypothetical protein BGZ68_006390 [Mortierella alpina]|nr:hypothetical protein BGZ68_006390 [Mortierella alpina]
MRITPDPFASSSRRPTPSSSTASLNTLVKDDPRSFTKTTPQTKAAQDPSQKPPALRVQSVSYAAAVLSATPPHKSTVPEKLTKGSTLLSVEIADAVKRTPIAAKHLSRAWTPSPTSDFLTIDTHQKPLWRSQSSDGLSSPSQLEGIVIESLKTPIQGAHGFLGATTCNTTIAGGPMDKAKGFAGEVFEAENDPIEQYGVPWMLYRHKSRSTGTIPCTYASTSLEAASAMETGAVILTRSKTPKESDTRGAHPTVPAQKEVLKRPARAEGSSGVSKRNNAGTVASTAVDSCARLPSESAVKPLKGSTECAVNESSDSTHAILHRPQRRDLGTAGGKRQLSVRRNQINRSDSQLLSDETDLQPAIEPQQTIRSQQTMPQQTVKPQQPLQPQQSVNPQQTMQSQQTSKPQQTIQSKRTDKPQHTVERQQIVKSQQITERQYTVNHVQIVEVQQMVSPQQKPDGQQTPKAQKKVERPQTAKLQPTIESYSSPLRPVSEVNDATIDLKADAPASAILADSTAHASTALGHVQDQNGAAQHQLNHSSINGHFRRAQQLYSRHIDMGMDASSPSTLFSHNSAVHSPALSDTTTSSSNHTESTFVSETFSTSSRTDSTTTGTSGSSQSCQTTRTITRWSTTPSSLANSDTASSVASTLYHHPHHYDHHHHNENSMGLVRGYITRAQEMVTSVSTATGTATSGAFSRVHRLFQTNRISIIFASNPSASSSLSPRDGPPSSSSPPETTTTQPSRSSPKIQPDKVPWWCFYHDSHRMKHSSPPPPTPPSSSSLSQPQGPNGHRYIPAPYGRNGRKGPKRPDEKAFFSNERTFMHWIKFGLLLGSMALTLCSFGQEVGLGVGLFLVTVAMSTLVYATTIYHLRHRWMTRARFDVKYYDRVGPSVLFLALFMAFAINVGCK